MFKVGEIVRINDAYKGFKAVSDRGMSIAFEGSFVVMDKHNESDFMGKPCTFYKLNKIGGDDVLNDIGEVWLEIDIKWYRTQKIKKICTRLGM